MKVIGATIQQIDKFAPDGSEIPKSECRRWRLWATTDSGRKSRRFNGRYREAQEALRAFVAELEAQMPPSEMFGPYAESWRLWRVNSGDVSPNTIAGDRTGVNALRRTRLEELRVDQITPADVREALMWLKCNPLRGGELKSSTVAKYRQTLNSILQQAEDDGKVAQNPCAKVKRPKVRFDEREALSPAELQLFLNRVDGLPVDGRTMALYLMACLGLRCGEAVALADSEIDSRYCTVTSTYRAADGSVGPPKSESGVRTLPVPPRLAEKVGQWRELRGALGLQGARYLCCNRDGGLMSCSSVGGWWRGKDDCVGARDKLGCPGMTLHQLRHSNLSMMARHMNVFDLKTYAGWSSIAPARIYVHDDLDSVARAVELAWA